VADDALCDNGLYCDGLETCDPVNDCQPGTAVDCDDGVGCTVDTCSETTQACDSVADDALCDNGLYCDGLETCDPVSDCQAGTDPCPDDCEACDEGPAACVPCLLDLVPGDGGIGTADVAVFAGCFGFCYPPDDPCVDANFDGDPGNCVGTADFAALAGCFGLTCGACPNCWPTLGPRAAGSGITSQASVQVVATRRQTRSDVASSLPQSMRAARVGQTFYVEVWASGQNDLGDGLASVYVDLGFDPKALTVEEVLTGDQFELFAAGSIDPVGGTVATLGGCLPLGQEARGMGTEWVRVATVRVTAAAAGQVKLTTRSAAEPYGIAILGQAADLDAEQLQFGQKNLWILESATPAGVSLR
jgi:hypothetical protein